MSRPTSRVLRLLELLQSAGTRSVRDLATRLEVDERTVRRYVEHLRDLDVPVESVRGRYGGYRIGAGFRMPPLMLSDDEALAVVLGLLRAQSVPGTSPATVQTATAKVRRSLPPEAARRLDALLRTTTFAVGQESSAATDAATLLTVADAITSRRQLAIRYRSAGGEPSQCCQLETAVVVDL